jgi:hypothetical protein
MKKIILSFGLISGLIVSTFMAVSMYLVSKNPQGKMGSGSMIIGYLSMLIAFALIYVAVKTYRDKHNEGMISFGKAFKMGFFIALIASTMYVIMWSLMYQFVMPDFMEVYSREMLNSAKGKSTAAEMAKMTEDMERNKELYKNPLFFTLFTYAEILPVGIIVSLITALILKRKNNTKVVVA